MAIEESTSTEVRPELFDLAGWFGYVSDAFLPSLKLRVRTCQEAWPQKGITSSNPSDSGATLVSGSVLFDIYFWFLHFS